MTDMERMLVVRRDYIAAYRAYDIGTGEERERAKKELKAAELELARAESDFLCCSRKCR